MEYCCFGKKKKERKRLIHEIKEDVLALTKEELEHLRNFILVPRDRYLTCC
jgi:hypothetical protein